MNIIFGPQQLHSYCVNLQSTFKTPTQLGALENGGLDQNRNLHIVLTLKLNKT